MRLDVMAHQEFSFPLTTLGVWMCYVASSCEEGCFHLHRLVQQLTCVRLAWVRQRGES
jgi:hypothetical protein